jgi:hypothetical protein
VPEPSIFREVAEHYRGASHPGRSIHTTYYDLAHDCDRHYCFRDGPDYDRAWHFEVVSLG